MKNRDKRLKLCIALCSAALLISCMSNNSVVLPQPEVGENGSLISFEYSDVARLSYVVTFPASYDESLENGFPLIIFLHSLEERGTNIRKVIDNPEGEGFGLAAYAAKTADFPFITVSPLCPGNTAWPLISGRLKKLIDEITSSSMVDVSRVYLTGVSMGGMGTWDLAADYPGLFAAAAPISGGVYPVLMNSSVERVVNLPIWAFHDRNDPSISPENVLKHIQKLEKAGGNIKYTITERNIHYIHDKIYEGDEIYRWFLSNRNNQSEK